MRIAIIDCGTNTFNLLVADAEPTGWQAIYQTKLAVKLGSTGFEQNQITPSRFYRGLDAMLCHQQNILNFSCDKVFAYATSAIREATNGNEFVQAVKSKLDISLEVVDGNREAELIYQGVMQTIPIGANPILIMDIGGGSVEFVIANNTGILWKESHLLGVSRLHEILKPEDKFSNENLNYLGKILDQALTSLRQAIAQHQPKWMVGSSGSFDTIFDLYMEGTNQKNIERGLCNEIPLHSFPGIHSWLLSSTFEQRLKHKVIPSIRAEYMPIASFLITYVLSIEKFDKLYQSAYSLKEGAMHEILASIDWNAEKLQ